MPVLPPSGIASYVTTAGPKWEKNYKAGTKQAGNAFTAVCVALAESGGNTEAYGTNDNGSHDLGLFQINDRAHADKLAGKDWKDPKVNAQIAYKIWEEAGDSFRPWVAFSSGKWKEKFKQVWDSMPEWGDTPGSVVGGGEDQTVTTSPLTDAAAAIGNVANGIFGIAQGAWKAGVWLGNPHNWKRVGMVAIGGAGLVGALVIISKPAGAQVADKAGKVASVLPAGRAATVAGKTARVGKALR